MINEQLLAILACPKCKGPIVYISKPAADAQAIECLDCSQCRLRYTIKDGIPVMLIEEAEKY